MILGIMHPTVHTYPKSCLCLSYLVLSRNLSPARGEGDGHERGDEGGEVLEGILGG